jgi:hypothetical protein
MSPKLPLPRLFRKGHDAKKREKSKTKKNDAIASSIVPATICTSITGTSMTDGESSQSETSRIPGIVKPQSSEQVMVADQPASSVPQAATMEVPTPTATPASITTSDTTSCDSLYLPEQLWDRAYNELRAKEPKLVDTYEKILSRALKGGNSSSITSELCENTIEQTNLMTRRSQMEHLVQAGLTKTDREDKLKRGIGGAMQGVLNLKDIVGSALQPMPHAAIVWTGVCFALQVSLFPQDCGNTY